MVATVSAVMTVGPSSQEEPTVTTAVTVATPLHMATTAVCRRLRKAEEAGSDRFSGQPRNGIRA